MARILIVDDASFVRNTLKDIVEKGGHTVVGMAADGEQAAALYRCVKPDIVTMDILMKGMNGIEALKNIRKYDAKAKVIVVSVLTTDETLKLAYASGAAGYVIKPYLREKILEEIDKVLRIRSGGGE